MKQVMLKFHDGTGPWAGRVDRAIRKVSDLTHVEALHPDGMSISSTLQDGGGGVRWKKINYSHPERWRELVLWLTDDEYGRYRMICDCCAAVGIKYDIRGAIGCALTGREDPTRYFCSEFTFDALLTLWLPARLNHKMHPRALYDIAAPVAALLDQRRADGLEFL